MSILKILSEQIPQWKDKVTTSDTNASLAVTCLPLTDQGQLTRSSGAQLWLRQDQIRSDKISDSGTRTVILNTTYYHQQNCQQGSMPVFRPLRGPKIVFFRPQVYSFVLNFISEEMWDYSPETVKIWNFAHTCRRLSHIGSRDFHHLAAQDSSFFDINFHTLHPRRTPLRK